LTLQYGYSSLVLIVVSGSAVCASEPIQLEPTPANIRHAGHIYYNIATGEKITTLIGSGEAQQAADGTAGSEIWIATTGAQCADQGFSTSYFFGIDYPTSHNCSGLSCELIGILFDWGDIAPDTVVDCVQIHWISDHADTDTDNDNNPDGVDGFAGYWTYWDAMNGRSPQLDSIALPIVQVAFYNLPGEYPIDTSTVVYYTADVDLGGSFASSLTFEIGDTDSNPQSAAVHNPRMDLNDLDSDGISDLDPDQDGLADWGWSVQFVQPGTIDVDNADSDSNIYTGIDGDPAAEELIAINFGSPTPGHAELNSQGEWVWISDGPTAGATEDAFALGLAEHPDGSGDITIAGTFYFGGFSCDPDPMTGQYTPATHFQTVLYGPFCGVCRADFAGNPDGSPDGALNFLDVTAFLSAYAQQDPSADFAGNPDGTPDGLFNFADIAGYLMEYSSGCSGC
jgi:hypothetical protein